MELIKAFEGIGKEDAGIAGGKGASLGEMTQAGIPVPPGFVVLSSTFDRFLTETDLDAEIDTALHSVNREEMHTVEQASAKIQELILNAKMPDDIARDIEKNFDELGAEFVAVRSSATAEDSASAAWAGQLDSYLNTTEGTLLENVQRCWASLFTPRAIFYRFEKELHTQKISVAVVVQKMVASEVSGIAFSVHPVTEDYNQLIIEAGFGLGEAIVSGQVTPDSYVVEKSPRRIIDTNVSTQNRALYRAEGGGNEWKDIAEPHASSQVLTETQVLELSELVIKIENHYGFPCDIEWAFEGGKFYIVQSRPITTLSNVSVTSSEATHKDGMEVEVDADNGVVRILSDDTSTSVRPEDYTFTFESQGTTFFFEYLVTEAYQPEGDSIQYSDGTDKRVFASNALIAQMKGEGARRTPADTNEAIRALTAVVDQIINEIPEYKTKVSFTKEDALHMIELLKLACKGYLYFDYMYWDLVFAKQADDASARENVELVQNFKNAVRSRLEPVYFGDGYMPTLVSQISKVSGIPVKDLNEYTTEELLKTFDGFKVGESELVGRRNAWVMHKTLKGITLLSGEEARALISKFDVSPAKTQSLKGKVANKGAVVRGKVAKIKRDYGNPAGLQKQVAAMNQGDVLVSETTDPELMEAFRKASAVVTDAGGLLSHAAITSRELGLPCIVETGFATKVLENGDEIEVDTDKGEVRILKQELSFGGREKWQRLFRVQGLRYFIDDLWMDYYQKLGALTVISNDIYTSYLPLAVVEKTKKEGAELVADASKFDTYESDFRAYMDNVNAIAKNFNYDNASKGELKTLLDQIAHLFTFYSKTEFFYTDGAYQKYQETLDPAMAQRLERWGVLKNEGRGFLNNIFFGVDAVLSKLLKALEMRFKVNERTLHEYSRQELYDLYDGVQVSDEVIKDRETAFYILGQGGQCLIETGVKAKSKIDSFQGDVSTESDVLKGVTAHRGKVRGSAFVLKMGYDLFDSLGYQMEKMQKGDILVAETTSPEYMPACQKAGAILTDQGGMLSHAAIVSRELNIPCIVGIGNATEVIKTGDELEVDAEKGIITILKKSEPVA